MTWRISIFFDETTESNKGISRLVEAAIRLPILAILMYGIASFINFGYNNPVIVGAIITPNNANNAKGIILKTKINLNLFIDIFASFWHKYESMTFAIGDINGEIDFPQKDATEKTDTLAAPSIGLIINLSKYERIFPIKLATTRLEKVDNTTFLFSEKQNGSLIKLVV